MDNKRWTYKQITAACEKRIHTLIELSRKATAEGHDGVAWIFAHQAESAFDTWHEIVMGWIEKDDTQRLMALARSARPADE